MRLPKKVLAPAAVVSTGLLIAATPAPSQAFTKKELTICHSTEAPAPVRDLEVVADGPSYKSASLDPNTCESWDVIPGRYKITFEDIEEVNASNDADSFGCPGGYDPAIEIYVKRQGDRYEVVPTSVGAQGALFTDVKKNRSTAVLLKIVCEEDP